MSNLQQKFPSEIIELPSKGHFYSQENPLSSGNIEIKYMTAKEEDILTSRNLIQKGIVLDKLLQSLIVTPIDYNDLLIGDKNAILFASRILAYGKDYSVEIECPSCGKKTTLTIDLSALGHKEVDLEKHFPDGSREVDFTLPASKVVVTLTLFTNQDEKAIEQDLKGLKKISTQTGTDFEITTRLKRIIVAINGDRDKAKINKFVSEDLLSRDSLAIRTFLSEVTPDVDSKFIFTCEQSDCGEERSMSVPLTAQFFWPTANR